MPTNITLMIFIQAHSTRLHNSKFYFKFSSTIKKIGLFRSIHLSASCLYVHLRLIHLSHICWRVCTFCPHFTDNAHWYSSLLLFMYINTLRWNFIHRYVYASYRWKQVEYIINDLLQYKHISFILIHHLFRYIFEARHIVNIFLLFHFL